MPDLEELCGGIDRAQRHARLLIAAESAAVGAALAAWSIPAGLGAAILFAVWRSPRASRRAVLHRLEQRYPDAHNLFVTIDEVAAGTLVVKPYVVERVGEDAKRFAPLVRVGDVFPLKRLTVLAVIAIAAWGAAAVVHVQRSRPATTIDGRLQTPASSAAAARPLSIRLTVRPPRYTARPPSSFVDPPQIEAIENSAVALEIDSASDGVAVEVNGASQPAVRRGTTFVSDGVLTRSGYILVTAADGARRTIPATVVPDALPTVRLAAPGRDLVYADARPRIRFEAAATDDFGLRAMTLRYTKVSGSGEQFQFTEGEIPLSIAKASEREWKGAATRSLAEVGLSEGDMLVYRAVAADERPGGGEASSDAFFVEISRLGVAAGDAFTVPEQETRYALSQQMLILKTERLDRRRGSMTPDAVREESQGLAVEQRMIRSEFVFMLGGEVEDEEVEAEQSTELQEGRLENRGQRDLRAATVAMSQAEKLLTGANTADALKAERAAVTAIQRAFTRDRYILRALATRTQLDAGRRLTGSIQTAVGWRRTPVTAADDRRTARLQMLLLGLGELRRDSGGTDPDAAARAAVLAESAIRIDPQSAPLRQLSADLQRLADSWRAWTPELRASALDRAAASAAAVAREAVADPAIAVGGSR